MTSWLCCPIPALNAECIHAYVLLVYCTCVTRPTGVFSYRSQNAVRHTALRQIVFYCLMDSEPEMPHTGSFSLFVSLSLIYYVTLSLQQWHHHTTAQFYNPHVINLSSHSFWPVRPQHWQVWPHLRIQRWRHSWDAHGTQYSHPLAHL